MSSKSDYIRWWTNYGEMANEEIEYPAFQAGRAFQHSVESSEIATLRAQLAEARDILIVLAYTDNMLSPEEKHEFVSVSIKTSTIRAARAWYNKVTTAQAVYTSGTPT